MGKGIYSGVSGTARKVRHIYAGVNGTARKVKRVYVGDSNGIAKLCWSSGEVAKYGTLEGISKAIAGAGQNKNYAVVLSVAYGNTYAYSYDESLTRKQHDSISSYSLYRTAPGTIGDYALFAGGVEGDSYSYEYESMDKVLAYNSSMTRSVLTLPTATDSMGTANVGNYIIFAGGLSGVAYTDSNDEEQISTNVVSSSYAYDSSLTRTNITSLSQARHNACGGSIGSYAVFAGGSKYAYGNGNETSTVDAYNESLTRTTASALSHDVFRCTSASVGKYLIITGGSYGKQSVIDCYDTSLTKTSIDTLSVARSHVAGASFGDYAMFAGGYNLSKYNLENTVDMYDESLTRTTGVALAEGRQYIKTAKVGDYLMFVGGDSNSSNASNYETDVYMLD